MIVHNNDTIIYDIDTFIYIISSIIFDIEDIRMIIHKMDTITYNMRIPKSVILDIQKCFFLVPKKVELCNSIFGAPLKIEVFPFFLANV